MKKIIDGKRYDTETATQLAEIQRGQQSSFDYFEEALYRTAKGAYFLAGFGHASSKYAVACGDGSRGAGHGLDVLTENEAYRWAERYLEADQVEARFGDRIEDA
jgi:hypothetical protein